MGMKISKKAFQVFTDDLFDYFGKNQKAPQNRLKMWFNKLKSFDEKDIMAAFEHIKDNLDGLPHNLPKALKMAIWQIGQDAPRPEVKAGAFGDCPDCGGIGFFSMRIKDSHGHWFECIQYCATCENYRLWVNTPGKRISRAELIKKGIRHKLGNRCLINSQDINSTGRLQDFKNIAAGFAEKKKMIA